MTRDVYVWIPGKLGLHLEPLPESEEARAKRLAISSLKAMIQAIEDGELAISNWSKVTTRQAFPQRERRAWHFELSGALGRATIDGEDP